MRKIIFVFVSAVVLFNLAAVAFAGTWSWHSDAIRCVVNGGSWDVVTKSCLR
ncbi:MAG: hypothetical protein UR28_C0002G0013 [Candidatus Peregrinibacteria bacterium GW2011_GWF2_33_10]|nr:MAG: hypothetical protein UR28_C0002G0013 [Candidatus Peregrinibacteria bacterium GW2011_GWF2_33_10]